MPAADQYVLSSTWSSLTQCLRFPHCLSIILILCIQNLLSPSLMTFCCFQSAKFSKVLGCFLLMTSLCSFELELSPFFHPQKAFFFSFMACCISGVQTFSPSPDLNYSRNKVKIETRSQIFSSPELSYPYF